MILMQSSMFTRNPSYDLVGMAGVRVYWGAADAIKNMYVKALRDPSRA